MSTILHIDSGINKSSSQTRALSSEFINQWKLKHPEDVVIVRDVVNPLVPHLDETVIAGFFLPEEQQSQEIKDLLRFSDNLVKELLEADVIVMGAPVYNLGIPWTLKSYIDHIARAGKTFNYTEKGPVGLVNAKTVHIVTARGGFADPSENHHEGYLRQLFQFLGISDVRFFHAEGLAIDDQTRENALRKVRSEISQNAAA